MIRWSTNIAAPATRFLLFVSVGPFFWFFGRFYVRESDDQVQVLLQTREEERKDRNTTATGIITWENLQLVGGKGFRVVLSVMKWNTFERVVI